MSEAFGKFELERKLAVGGMAEIFLGSVQGPEGFRKTVAIKRILPHLTEDPDFVTMFLDEARLVARFNHPNIVQIFELGEVDGRYFLSMEYVHGVSMSKVIKASAKLRKPLPLEFGAKIVSFACEGLDYAHNFVDANGRPLNLIHRDVSPQNLMLSYDGVVKVLDFGIAKAVGNLYQTRSSSLKGKAAYMSPEQITQSAGLDRRSDVFALGIVLYEFATGRRPFEADAELELMMSIVQKPVPDPRVLVPTLPEPFVAIMHKALAKDREQRYPSCRALRADLEKFLIDQRLMVDTYALSGFLRDLIPPGDVRMGAALPTPSQPSVQRAQVEVALRDDRSAPGRAKPSPHTPTGKDKQAPRTPTGKQQASTRTPTGQRKAPTIPVVDEEPATVLTPSRPISARLSPPEPAPEVSPTSLRTVPSTPPPRAAGPSTTWIVAGFVLVGLIGAGGAYLLLDDTDPEVPLGKDGAVVIPRDQADAGVAEREPPGEPDAGGAVVAPGPVDAGVAAAPDGALDAAAEPGPGIPSKVVKGVGGKRKKKIDAPPLGPNPPDPPPEPPPEKPPKPPVAMVEGKGKLTVYTSPWTDVTVDGMAYGSTPVTSVDLDAGLHEVELVNKASGIRLKKQIRIVAGQTQRIQEKFGQGQVQVFVKPFGEVFVNGVSKGVTPLDGPITLYEGTHTVRVVNAKAGKEETRQVRLTAGQFQKLIFDLR